MKPATPIIAISGGGRNKGDDYLQIAKMFGAEKVFEMPLSNHDFTETVNDLQGQYPFVMRSRYPMSQMSASRRWSATK